MPDFERQKRYRRRVLLKARLYDQIVEKLGPLRKSHDEIDRILAEAEEAKRRAECLT